MRLPFHECPRSSSNSRPRENRMLGLAGAQAINQQPLNRIEVHGKNLFYFFGEGESTVVLHIHFGMSGAFKTVARGDTLPEPKETTRLVLIGEKVVGQLSAMIVQHGSLGVHLGKPSLAIAGTSS